MNPQPLSSLSIFFPARNEAANIRASVEAAEAIARRVATTYEIIIVNDGSTDDTGSIADGLARDNDRVRVVHHTINKGYGAAVWSGMSAARYDYVFFTDADLQFDLAELALLAQFIPEYRVVLGYRAHRQDNGIRILNGLLWNMLIRLLFGLHVRDIDCAFKLMDRKLVQSLPMETKGAMFSAEMLIRLQRQRVAFKEVPVSHFARLKGAASGGSPKVILRAFKELFRFYLRGSY